MKLKYFSEQAVKRLAAEYLAGRVTLREISRELDCSIPTARGLLARYGVRPRRGRPPGRTKQVAAYIKDVAAGASQAEVARRHGVSRQAVNQAMRYHGR